MNKKAKAYLLLSVIWTVVIFSLSLQVREASHKTSSGILSVFLNLFKNFSNLNLADFLPLLEHYLRKLSHLTEYFILALFVSSFFLNYKWGLKYLTLLCGLLVAITDECIQIFVPGRGPMVSDVVLDFFGVLLGFLLIYIYNKKAVKKSIGRLI